MPPPDDHERVVVLGLRGTDTKGAQTQRAAQNAQKVPHQRSVCGVQSNHLSLQNVSCGHEPWASRSGRAARARDRKMLHFCCEHQLADSLIWSARVVEVLRAGLRQMQGQVLERQLVGCGSHEVVGVNLCVDEVAWAEGEGRARVSRSRIVKELKESEEARVKAGSLVCDCTVAAQGSSVRVRCSRTSVCRAACRTGHRVEHRNPARSDMAPRCAPRASPVRGIAAALWSQAAIRLESSPGCALRPRSASCPRPCLPPLRPH